MPTSTIDLADRVDSMREVSLESLDEAHDVFVHTKSAWRLLQIGKGPPWNLRFVLRNRVTGSSISETELAEISQKYVTQYMSAACLQRLVSVFEEFVFQFLAEYHAAFPRSLAGKQFSLETVLAHSSIDEVIRTVIDRHVRDLAYQSMEKWFGAIERIAKNGVPDDETVARLKEAKASRDVTVHNQGVVNVDYVNRSGSRARFDVGDRLEIPESYLRDSHGLIRDTIAGMAEAASKKLRA